LWLFPHFILLGVARFSNENPPPLVKLMPVMAEYDMGEAPMRDEDGAPRLPVEG
jgi:hypothetical protein